MTTLHPLQLHLFDAISDPAAIPPERRQRLLKLTGDLIREAAQNEIPQEDLGMMETIDE